MAKWHILINFNNVELKLHKVELEFNTLDELNRWITTRNGYDVLATHTINFDNVNYFYISKSEGD